MRPFKFPVAAGRAYIYAGSALACFALAAGCRPGSPAPETQDAKPIFVVTIPPLGAFLRPIVDGRAEVVVLVPPGASEHTYELNPAGARAASKASAVIYLDDSLDGWAARLDAPARLRLIESFPPDLLRHYDDDNGALDPHVWLDPNAMRAALLKTVAALSKLDPDGAEIYRRNAEAFSIELTRLDEELAQTLAPLRGKSVIQFHPSLYYFLERYGIRTAGVIETIAGQEPSPKAIKGLADLVRAENVEVIVTEPQLADAPVRALAEAAGVRIAHLDPLGGVPGRETYAELLRYNARALIEAFP